MKKLKNRYYAFRHGQSRSNVEGIIISDPQVGTVSYGLTEEGRRQAEAGARASGLNGAEVLIFTSDFKRASETAEIVCEVLAAGDVIYDERLRERSFWEFEGQSFEKYADVWIQDASGPVPEYSGAESCAAVRSRMWSFVESMEVEYEGRDIVLVSHGDPLVILQTAFDALNPRDHRSIAYIENAECRLLNPAEPDLLVDD
jgi:broad specificity phosphatase PhoE